jgi:hypothetical protein
MEELLCVKGKTILISEALDGFFSVVKLLNYVQLYNFDCCA